MGIGRSTGALARWPRSLVVASAATLLFTAAVVLVPSLRFAYDNLSLHVALETAEGMVAAVLTALCAGRFVRTRRLADLLLAGAFALLALTNLAVSALPMIAVEDRPEGFVTWVALVLRVEAAVALCAAAFVDRPARSGRWSFVFVIGPGVAVVGAALADAWLAAPVDPSLSPQVSGRPAFGGHAAVVVALAVTVVLHVAAAVGFTRRASERTDPLLAWLAAGTTVSAGARVHYLLFPSLYSEWVYTGDLLRLASYSLFLTGAVGSLVSHWRSVADVAVANERARLARELHDGLVQELSFIRSQTVGRTVVQGPLLEHITDAAERGLAESRLAVDALDDEHTDVADAVRAAAEAVGHRAGASVSVSSEGTPVMSLAVRHALLRITREATTNAVRHGQARAITIGIGEVEGGVRLVVTDDGGGFDPATAPRGFGLQSVRERVGSLGGRVVVETSPGRGTTISVVVPTSGADGEPGRAIE